MRDLAGEAGTAGFRQELGHRPGGIPDVEGPGGKVPRNGGSVPLRTAEAAVLCEQGSPGHYGGGHLRIYASLQGNPPGVKPDAQERTGGLQQLLRMAAGQGPDSEESHGPGGGDQGGAEDPQALHGRGEGDAAAELQHAPGQGDDGVLLQHGGEGLGTGGPEPRRHPLHQQGPDRIREGKQGEAGLPERQDEPVHEGVSGQPDGWEPSAVRIHQEAA